MHFSVTNNYDIFMHVVYDGNAISKRNCTLTFDSAFQKVNNWFVQEICIPNWEITIQPQLVYILYYLS